MEVYVLKLANERKSKHFCTCKDSGIYDRCLYLVMTLVGPCLQVKLFPHKLDHKTFHSPRGASHWGTVTQMRRHPSSTPQASPFPFILLQKIWITITINTLDVRNSQKEVLETFSEEKTTWDVLVYGNENKVCDWTREGGVWLKEIPNFRQEHRTFIVLRITASATHSGKAFRRSVLPKFVWKDLCPKILGMIIPVCC